MKPIVKFHTKRNAFVAVERAALAAWLPQATMSDRNRAIVQEYTQGASGQALAERYGLARSRVQIILDRAVRMYADAHPELKLAA